MVPASSMTRPELPRARTGVSSAAPAHRMAPPVSATQKTPSDRISWITPRWKPPDAASTRKAPVRTYSALMGSVRFSPASDTTATVSMTSSAFGSTRTAGATTGRVRWRSTRGGVRRGAWARSDAARGLACLTLLGLVAMPRDQVCAGDEGSRLRGLEVQHDAPAPDGRSELAPVEHHAHAVLVARALAHLRLKPLALQCKDGIVDFKHLALANRGGGGDGQRQLAHRKRADVGRRVLETHLAASVHLARRRGDVAKHGAVSVRHTRRRVAHGHEHSSANRRGVDGHWVIRACDLGGRRPSRLARAKGDLVPALLHCDDCRRFVPSPEAEPSGRGVVTHERSDYAHTQAGRRVCTCTVAAHGQGSLGRLQHAPSRSKTACKELDVTSGGGEVLAGSNRTAAHA